MSRSDKPFVRPNNTLPDRILNQFLPPQPFAQQEYCPPKTLHATPQDYAAVFQQIVLTLIIGGLQIWLFRWTAAPPVLLLVNWFWKLEPLLGTGFQVLRWLIVAVIFCWFAYRIARDSERPGISLSLYRWNLPLALWAAFIDGSTQRAATEEQWYREGAETWTPQQRLTSNLVFGFSHITTIFYPIAIYLPLCMLGHTLTQAYLQELQQTHSRDEALIRAIVVHRLYNWTAPLLFVPYILAVIALA